MPSRKRSAPERKIPLPVVERVLDYVRQDISARGALPTPGIPSRSPGAVFHLERPASLREGEVVVLVIDRNMTVARTVQMAPGTRGARDPSALLDDAAVRLAEMELVRRDLLDPALPRPEPALGVDEEALLRRGGFEPGARAGTEGGPAAQAQAEFAALLADSLTVEQAAKALRVNGSRIRQRLGARTLYGLKMGGSWRVPRFQLHGGKAVPGLEVVLPAVPPDVHPVALHRWLTSPAPDLTAGDEERAVSPLDWLRSGGNPARLAELARSL